MAHLKALIPTVAVVAGLSTAGVAGIAHADTTSSNTGDSSSTSQSSMPADGNGPQQQDGGVIVTDDTVNAAIKSALEAKYSDVTVDRAAKLPDGSYLAFTKQSGNKVIVSLDSSYNVTSTKDVPANAPGRQAPTGSSDSSSTSS
jgi:hypothetical protein